MRTFSLWKFAYDAEVTRVETVAEGVIFTNGKVVIGGREDCSLRGMTSVTVYDSMEDMEKVHGHNGDTKVMFFTE